VWSLASMGGRGEVRGQVERLRLWLAALVVASNFMAVGRVDDG
jgi:hypothetical protein